MKRIRLFAGRVTEKLGVAPEIALEIPRVTMLGNNELLIENHRGIIEYSKETVRIAAESGVIVIEGRDIVLNMMNKDSVAVSGHIYNVMKLDGGVR